MTRIVITQSNYIPWKGYFDMIASADHLVLYDDVQFTRRDWRNRNRIKTPQGLHWLTIPVEVKGRYHQSVRETRTAGPGWAAKHWRTIASAYARAAGFAEAGPVLEALYAAPPSPWLSEINRHFLDGICRFLGIGTAISASSDYELVEGRTERLADLTEKLGGSCYVTGPAAKSYLQEAAFARRGIAVEWFDYSGYPEYPQLWGGFEHAVSIVDLLAMTGRQAPDYMKWAGRRRPSGGGAAGRPGAGGS